MNKGCVSLCLLNDGMATSNDVDGVTLVELWAAVVMLGGNLRKAEVDIYFGKSMGSIEDVLCCVYGDISAELGE